MKTVIVKALVAVAALTAWGSASATIMYLNQVGLRAGSGSYYASGNPSGLTMNYDGADGQPATTAAWDWTGGVLTQTSGMFRANQHPGSFGTTVLSDETFGLVINTNTGTTTATSYRCIEGNFGGSTGANSCANTSYGFDFVDQSSVAYNVGGMADCEQRTIGGDDSSGTPAVFRGLRSWNGGNAPCSGTNSDNSGRGAMDMINVIVDNGSVLMLANANAAVPAACYNPGSAASADPSGNLCSRAHWLVFSTTVPVPAAVWLFGSALGLLGWVRRRISIA